MFDVRNVRPLLNYKSLFNVVGTIKNEFEAHLNQK